RPEHKKRGPGERGAHTSTAPESSRNEHTSSPRRHCSRRCATRARVGAHPGRPSGLGQHRHRIDLHELIVITQRGHPQQGAGRIVLTHAGPHHLPGRHQILLAGTGHIHRGPHHIGQPRAGLGQGGGQVVHDLAGLPGHIANGHRHAPHIQRTSTRGPHHPCGGVDHRRVGIVHVFGQALAAHEHENPHRSEQHSHPHERTRAGQGSSFCSEQKPTRPPAPPHPRPPRWPGPHHPRVFAPPPPGNNNPWT